MNDALIFLLLFFAIAIGWYLGRRGAGPNVAGGNNRSDYYKGLNYLLDTHADVGHDNIDSEVDSYVSNFEVSSETLEAHITIGKVLRKRGEVDRAIRIHQNILSLPDLSQLRVHEAHLELARDYVAAGLLDRAEQLFLDLAQESPLQRRPSLRHLQEVYQSERDWPKAIAVARALLSSDQPNDAREITAPGQPVTVALSHYHCELATQALKANDEALARRELGEALAQDAQCARASLLLGELELRAGNVKRAVSSLRKIRQQNPDFIVESIPLLRQCYETTGDTSTLQTYLRDCLDAAPTAPLVLAIAEDLQQSSGEAAAAEFLSSQLADRPSLRGLQRLIGMQLASAEGAIRGNLAVLQVLVERLIEERPGYRCGNCGFSGTQLHWSCPSCKHWSTMKTSRESALK
ncbi:MAG: lipopolysaccharide assembly protein LapB [Halioglobus sp.]